MRFMYSRPHLAAREAHLRSDEIRGNVGTSCEEVRIGMRIHINSEIHFILKIYLYIALCFMSSTGGTHTVTNAFCPQRPTHSERSR